MKPYVIVLIILLTAQIHAQHYHDYLETLRSAEAKTALLQMKHSQNSNTGNYDVKYHRLELNVDPSVAEISGAITTYFEAKEAMTELTFDLANNMTVSQVVQRGNSLGFTQNTDDELVITLPELQQQGVLDSLTVHYSGNPVSSGFGSFEQTTHGNNGDPIIWTLSEPYGAKGWWPCKQDLIDKIDSIDVYITTPKFNPSNESYVAVSNGLEMGQTVEDTEKTTHFKHRYPIPAYLIAIAVTNYEVYSHQVSNNGNPFDIVNYVYPQSLTTAQASTGVTVDIMNIFTDLFEEYPFADEKYGHAQFGWGGGMEHTTVSFMGSFNRGLIAHELAHQWFGNKITCGSWKDIWLNEGFATYLSGLVIEDLDGASGFKSWRQQVVSNITSLPDGAVYLTDQDTTSVSRIFNSRLSYNKGAMVLHQLRRKLGDTQFFQGLKDYLAAPELAYGYAKTQDFIDVMESSTGEDLEEFFNDWVYNQGYPSYHVQWHQSANQLYLTISQTQSHTSVSFFEAAVPFRITGTAGEVLDVVLEPTETNEDFVLAVDFTVENIELDPDYHLISGSNSISLGTLDYEDTAEVTVFPNPVSSVLNFTKPNDLEVTSIRIYNSLGQLLLQTQWRTQVDLNAIVPGVLFVEIETPDQIINKKVVKK